MSEMPKDLDLKALLRSALPEDATPPRFEVDLLRGRARVRVRTMRFVALYVAYAMVVVCMLVLGLGFLAERHYARLLHEALLQLPAE